MKQLNPSGLFYVAIPLESHNIQDTKADGIMWQMPDGSWDSFYFEDELTAPYEIIGWCTNDDISFDPDPYVDKTKHYTWGGYGYAKTEDVFVNYMHIDVAICRSSVDSFRSLLTANDVRFVNPHGAYPQHIYSDSPSADKSQMYQKALSQWQQAESKLVEKILILKPL